MSIESLFNKRATILRHVPADPSWGSSDVYGEEENIPCRLRTVSGNEYTDGKVRAEATHRVYLTCQIKLDVADMIRIDDIDYDILPPINNAGGAQDHHMEVDLKEHMW